MDSLDLDLDAQINSLELEWRSAYDAYMIARADYEALRAANPGSAKALNLACARLKRGEAEKARILAKIKRLEDKLLGQGSDLPDRGSDHMGQGSDHRRPPAHVSTANSDSKA